jgi:aryl-alcohol dehydrogenase-like predicted oxidoreductase
MASGLLSRPPHADLNPASGRSLRAATDQLSPVLYNHPNDWDVVDAVESVAHLRAIPMAEVAMSWVLGRPGVASGLVGATKLEHLESALRALEVDLTAEETAALEAPYRPHAVKGHNT